MVYWSLDSTQGRKVVQESVRDEDTGQRGRALRSVSKREPLRPELNDSNPRVRCRDRHVVRSLYQYLSSFGRSRSGQVPTSRVYVTSVEGPTTPKVNPGSGTIPGVRDPR